MGKLREVARQAKTQAKTPRKASSKSRPRRLTSEEAARLAAFDAVVKMRDEQWAAMTPQEQKEEVEAWEKVKKSVNDSRAGYRQVFVDD